MRDFFPLGGRPIATVKDTAGRRRREGEQRVGPNEIGAQCAIRESDPSPTVIREGPEISVRPPRQGVPTFPFKIHPLGILMPIKNTALISSVTDLNIEWT